MESKKNYTCKTCGKMFSSITSLSNHVKNKHGSDVKRKKNKDDGLYHCRFCEKPYKFIQARWSHQKICNLKVESTENIINENLNLLTKTVIDEINKRDQEILDLQNKLLESKNALKNELNKLKTIFVTTTSQPFRDTIFRQINKHQKYFTKNNSEIEDNIVKTKKKTISSTIKKLVWNTNIGENIGKSKCMCCNSTDITQISFHCGHIIAESNGGETTVSNLKPICQNCNSSMKTKNMYDFMNSLK